MIKNKISVVILRHPQEQDVILGTANIIAGTLENCKVVTGLTWPNFEKVLGAKADPKKWGVLYLGSVVVPEDKTLCFVNKKGEVINDDKGLKEQLEGILVLDGTWTQAKSLWWKNAWLLKLQRIVIKPFMPSLYGKLRKEPRRESVSSLEAVANTLVALGEPVETSKALISSFRKLLDEHRNSKNKKPLKEEA